MNGHIQALAKNSVAILFLSLSIEYFVRSGYPVHCNPVHTTETEQNSDCGATKVPYFTSMLIIIIATIQSNCLHQSHNLSNILITTRL